MQVASFMSNYGTILDPEPAAKPSTSRSYCYNLSGSVIPQVPKQSAGSLGRYNVT